LDQLTKSMHWERSVATIADVARKAGVSVATASHVLNGTRRVAPDPAHPAEATTDWFGDRLNIMARGLTAASTRSIITAVRNRGLQVPKDFSVVGFEWAGGFEQRLTLAAHPSPEIGGRAASLLKERIAVPSSSGRAINLDAAIVARESRGRPK
jgi:DNA-binding LacI/PurR family transcriptional regulator